MLPRASGSCRSYYGRGTRPDGVSPSADALLATASSNKTADQGEVGQRDTSDGLQPAGENKALKLASYAPTLSVPVVHYGRGSGVRPPTRRPSTGGSSRAFRRTRRTLFLVSIERAVSLHVL